MVSKKSKTLDLCYKAKGLSIKTDFKGARMIQLKSVGCGIDFKTLLTYPMYDCGGYDSLGNLHLSECGESFFTRLNESDFETVEALVELHSKLNV